LAKYRHISRGEVKDDIIMLYWLKRFNTWFVYNDMRQGFRSLHNYQRTIAEKAIVTDVTTEYIQTHHCNVIATC